MLISVIKKGGGVDNEEDTPAMNKALGQGINKVVVKGKVKSIARMSRIYQTLREESEMLLKIKNISPDGKLPRGILLEGKPAIKNGKLTSSL